MTRLNSKLHIKHLINLRNIIFKENKIRHPKIKFLNINKGMKKIWKMIINKVTILNKYAKLSIFCADRKKSYKYGSISHI